jgi:hypothetical protein
MTTRRLLIGLVFTAFLGMLLLDASRNEVQSKISGAPAGYTACPNEYSGRTCTSCHSDFNAASVSGWISSNVPAAGYTAGATYTITATATGAGFPVFGFEIAPLGAAGVLLGTPLITNTTETKLVSSKYVTHTSSGISGSGSKTWTFNWTAPAAGTGPVTFYGSFLLGDGDGGEGGDYVKTGTLTINEASCSAPAQPGAIAGNASPCAGSSVTYSVAAVAGATSYSWTLPSGWSGTSTTNSITVTAGSTSGTVAVAAVNACGTSPSSTVGVVVGSVSTPTVTAGGATTFCQGGSVTLTSSSGSSYLWSPGGQTTQSITVSASGSYRVTVTNAGGCTASSSVTTVTVNAAPTATVTAGGPVTFCQGGSVTLTASSGSSYSWSPGGQTTQSITATTSGSYRVTVTNASGCTASSSVTTVTVNPAPTATITAGGPTTFCQGGSVTLTASAGSAYLWSPGGATTQSITVGSAGSYAVTVTNAAGCTAVSSPEVVTVTTNGVATISASGPLSFCNGGSVTLTASAGNSYVWSPGGETTQSITVSSSGSYAVSVTGACSGVSDPAVVTVNANPTVSITASGPTTVCAGDPLSLSATSGSSYLWSPGGETTPSIQPTASGNYSVTVTDANGCSGSSDPTAVTVNPVPQVSLSSLSPVCDTASAFALTGGAPAGGVYSGSGVSNGSFDPSAAGVGSNVITYLYTDNNGCSGTAATTVEVLDCNNGVGGCSGPPRTPFYLIGPRIVSCGQSGVIYSVPNDTAATSYSWSVPAGAIITANNGNSITVDFPAGVTGGDVCVTAVNACGSSAPLCRTIQAGGLYTRRIRGPQEVCRTDAAVVYYIPQVPGAVSYTWTIGGNAGLTVNGNNVTVDFSSCTLNRIVLRVVVTNACGDVRSRSLWIHVRDCQGGHDDDDDDDDDGGDRLTSAFGTSLAPIELKVFPNPASGLFTVEFPAGRSGPVQVILMDLTGKEVAREERVLTTGEQTVGMDISRLSPGLYFLRAEQEGAVGNERIVIAR